MSFPARFESKCATCRLRIYPGDQIMMNDEAHAVHEECIPAPEVDPTVLRPTEVVCPDCWTVKPCRCDE